jgi:hypothetical protein
MPRWPWCSVALLDEVRASRDEMRAMAEDLRRENRELVDSLVRLRRHQEGMPEVPRAARPTLSPPPLEFLKYCESVSPQSIARSMRDNGLRRHARGEPWFSIMSDIMDSEEEEGEPYYSFETVDESDESVESLP